MCRGNYKSTFMGAGGYDAVQEILFNKINVHGYFMEYDDARSGGFEPLRMLPKGKQVVLGIVTTKTGKLESKDDLKRRIDEAAKFAPLDQLCLSGQCGFASTEEGNTLTEDEQWAKLAPHRRSGGRSVGMNMQRTKPPFRADHVGSFLRTAADQGRAREAREGRDHGRATEGGRGRRDQEDHRQTGRVRPAARDRRRVPPLVVALRFPLRPRRRGDEADRAAASSSPACRPRRSGPTSSARSAFPAIR